MPLYEYYCKRCDGAFEAMGKISDASAPASCPVCAKSAERMMPTSFSAFTMREGYPRAIPDRGTYYHLGKEVKKPITGGVRMNEHPEINKPRPPRRKSKGEVSALQDQAAESHRERKKMLDSGVTPIDPPRVPRLLDDD